VDQKIDTPRAQSGTVAVLIPCYNEAVTIGKVVDDFRRVLPEATVYVYDNNSSDGTASIAAEHGAVVRAERRQGKGQRRAPDAARHRRRLLLMVDGDDTYPAEAAKALCEPILNGTADMTVGDRLSNGTYAEENKRAFHGFGNNLVRAMIKWIYGYSFDDVMTGYRAMSRPFVKTFPVLSEGFQIETELSIHAVDHRWRIKDVPIEYRDRPEGSESKLNTVSDGIKVVAMIGTLFKDCRPLKFFSLVALLFAVFGLALGMPIVVEYFQTGLVPRFPTAMLAASFMFLCGLSLATGFILDSVAKVEKKQWEVNVYSKYAYDDQPGRSATTPSER
jgi:Glycosyltransferases involved in cell wall biogenesis